MTVADVIEAALALSDADREIVMREMAISLDRDDFNVDDDIQSAWDVEISSRVDDIVSGRVQGVPYDQVMAEARRVASEVN